MENLEKTFDQQLKNIDELENAIHLLFEKASILPELNILEKKAASLQVLTNDIKTSIVIAKGEQCDRSKTVLKKLQKQQLIFVKLMEVMETLKPAEVKVEKQRLPLTNLNVQTSFNKLSGEKSELPRMYVSEFQNLPFVAKMRALSLNFLDFDAQLTQKQFDIIPKYMKGRETRDELNSFLETIIIQCFNDKYSLVYKNREAVKTVDKTLWNVYRHQLDYFPGRKFITRGDISRSIGRLIDTKMNSRIQILKHVGFMKEERKESIICYIWNIN